MITDSKHKVHQRFHAPQIMTSCAPEVIIFITWSSRCTLFLSPGFIKQGLDRKNNSLRVCFNKHTSIDGVCVCVCWSVEWKYEWGVPGTNLPPGIVGAPLQGTSLLDRIKRFAASSSRREVEERRKIGEESRNYRLLTVKQGWCERCGWWWQHVTRNSGSAF